MELVKDCMKLGFGLMRLPQLADKTTDVEQTKQMVDAFIAAGGKYFDTAYIYAGSEPAAKEALCSRYPRESYYLADKLNAAAFACSSEEEAKNEIKVSLERTGAGYFDFYLLHGIDAENIKRYDSYGIWDYMHQLKSEGLIKHIGFSFHDSPELLEEIIEKHPEVEFVQLQINYQDWEAKNVQSRANYEVARKHGKKIVIMEPIKGGLLASPPASVEKIFKDADPDASCASWAIRFAASLEGVLVVLSGMSTLDQMKDNLSYMTDFQHLSMEENAVIEDAREALSKLPVVPCTNCNYCAKVCPQNVGISGTFSSMNLYTLYGNLPFAKNKERFDVIIAGKAEADACIKCGLCEEACPQRIPIREELEKAAALFCQ